MYNYNGLTIYGPFKRMGGNAEEDKNKVAPMVTNIEESSDYQEELSMKRDYSHIDCPGAVVPNRTYPVIVSRIVNEVNYNLFLVDYPGVAYYGSDLYMLQNEIRRFIYRTAINGNLPEPTPASEVKLLKDEFLLMIDI